MCATCVFLYILFPLKMGIDLLVVWFIFMAIKCNYMNADIPNITLASQPCSSLHIPWVQMLDMAIIEPVIW